MPVNIDRLIRNVKFLRGVKDRQVTDLEPRHYFKRIKDLQESLCVLPQARLENKGFMIEQAHFNSTMLFKIFMRRMLCAKKIFFEERLDTLSFDQLIDSVQEVFRSAIVNPGEMVGSIGAQSMGEPATQMTLNTFHNTGISSKNVTLGVPRLKEVINIAKTNKTPSLKIFLTPETQHDQTAAHKIGQTIQYTNLQHLVADWGIYYDPDPKNTIVKADQDLLDLNFDSNLQMMENDRQISKWILRFAIDSTKVLFDEDFEFRRDVGDRISYKINGNGNPSE